MLTASTEANSFKRTWVHIGALMDQEQELGLVDLTVSFSADDSTSLQCWIRPHEVKTQESKVWQYFSSLPTLIAVRSIAFGKHIESRIDYPLRLVPSTDDRFVFVDAQRAKVGFPITTANQSASYKVVVYLLPCGSSLASTDSSQRGQTTDIAEPVRLDLDYGTLMLTENILRCEDTQEAVRIERSLKCLTLVGEFSVAQPDSFSDIENCVAVDVADACQILSLCTRQRVTPSWATYELVGPKESSYPSACRRHSVPHAGAGFDMPLVDVEELRSGGLANLVEAYQSHPNRERLLRAITLLQASHDTPILEAGYFLAFSALEALAGSGTEQKTSRGDTWHRELIAELTSALENFAQTRGLDQDMVTRISKGIPGLVYGGRPLLTRLMESIDAAKVQVDDLWPRDGLKAGLSEAINTRNPLVHAGVMRDGLSGIANLVRICILIERLILASLGWPQSGLSTRHDHELRAINAWP